tara:strand:+ start:1451 stop:1648 length:198 start_codon:yes stop_codon:yes gene_type:complete
MVTSRQVVKIINEELQKDLDDSSRAVLSRVKDKIEILEEIEYLGQYKQPAVDRSDAFKEAEKMFK